MKKVFLTAAVVLGGLSTLTASALAHTGSEIISVVNQEFKEVSVDQLPQAVKDALASDFKTATLNKASVNDKEQYKLELTLDGNEGVIYADKDGNWIEM